MMPVEGPDVPPFLPGRIGFTVRWPGPRRERGLPTRRPVDPGPPRQERKAGVIVAVSLIATLAVLNAVQLGYIVAMRRSWGSEHPGAAGAGASRQAGSVADGSLRSSSSP